MYLGRETRAITKIFRRAGIKIAYTTKNTIRNLLSQPRRKSNPYESNGVYQLTCGYCGKQYVGQTIRPIHTRYKEHKRDYHQNCKKSLYAKHLLEHQHAITPMETCMTILHHQRKGKKKTEYNRAISHLSNHKNWKTA
jgi:hypothetical protein